MSHTCHLPGCKVSVPPRMLFCGRHWAMVPAPLQRQVWATYQPGQERTKTFTPEYACASYNAQIAVLVKLHGEQIPGPLLKEASVYLRYKGVPVPPLGTLATVSP